MELPKPKDITVLSAPEIRIEITNIAKDLRQKRLLPSGLDLLMIGSTQYRRQTLFYDSGANKGHFRGGPELDPLWKKWIELFTK